MGHVNLEESLFVANLWLLSFTMLLLLVTAVAIIAVVAVPFNIWFGVVRAGNHDARRLFLAVREAPLTLTVFCTAWQGLR